MKRAMQGLMRRRTCYADDSSDDECSHASSLSTALLEPSSSGMAENACCDGKTKKCARSMLQRKTVAHLLILATLYVLFGHKLQAAPNVGPFPIESLPAEEERRTFVTLPKIGGLRGDQREAPDLKGDTKYIYWRSFFTSEGRDIFASCPTETARKCYATPDPKFLPHESDFDAVVISPQSRYDRGFHGQADIDAMNAWRQPRQYFVMFNEETMTTAPDPSRFNMFDIPEKYFDKEDKLKSMDNFFNWTMSYLEDSDFPWQYGHFKPKKDESQMYVPPIPRGAHHWMDYDKDAFLASLPSRSEEFKALAKRPKQASWLVSHCKTWGGRELYIQELAKHMNVSILGNCGSPIAPLPWYCGKDCYDSIDRDHKFYLAFENSLCNEYVTEKFFWHASNSIAVVFGQADYTKYAPPHSYINALDFASPKALADYLIELDNDDAKYLSYFWWKDHYDATGDFNKVVVGSMCDLCERLHEVQPHRSEGPLGASATSELVDGANAGHNPTTRAAPHSVYSNIYQWWTQRNQCNSKVWMPDSQSWDTRDPYASTSSSSSSSSSLSTTMQS